ncbi:hypothetical protein ASE77_09045 [Sphingomonas sp. Leaf226]|nr:hypothetical protein NI18_12755 [Sphingomonas sp. Ant20]KQM92816.1 hypothetical protein ASE77_09045 [Sphingomonas sp. Leaf226]
MQFARLEPFALFPVMFSIATRMMRGRISSFELFRRLSNLDSRHRAQGHRVSISEKRDQVE